jgi:hypothetical protein
VSLATREALTLSAIVTDESSSVFKIVENKKAYS